ncbi:MAG: cupin domain-containing protein [Phycisphaerae bacterium]|nr:cupin domain-containing protein [Phycisphaerae bacterium]
MSEIKVEKNPSRDRLDELGVFGWSVWTKEVSEFPWSCDTPETCYFLDGNVVVPPEGGEPLEVGKGDLVTFPQGLSCTWTIRKAVRKHYTFG